MGIADKLNKHFKFKIKNLGEKKGKVDDNEAYGLRHYLDCEHKDCKWKMQVEQATDDKWYPLAYSPHDQSRDHCHPIPRDAENFEAYVVKNLTYAEHVRASANENAGEHFVRIYDNHLVKLADDEQNRTDVDVWFKTLFNDNIYQDVLPGYKVSAPLLAYFSQMFP